MYIYIKGKDNVRILVSPAIENYIGAMIECNASRYKFYSHTAEYIITLKSQIRPIAHGIVAFLVALPFAHRPLPN